MQRAEKGTKNIRETYLSRYRHVDMGADPNSKHHCRYRQHLLGEMGTMIWYSIPLDFGMHQSPH